MKNILHPDLYRLWQEHDLAPERCPDFYRGLREEDRPLVWRFIEQNYLCRYKSFLRIWFEWGADGIWGIPFPGSVSVGGCYGPENLGLPTPLADRLKRWHDYIDENYCPWLKNAPPFDWDTYNREGLGIAKSIKAHVGADIYLEYNEFRELKVIGTDVVELPVPDFAAVIQRE